MAKTVTVVFSTPFTDWRVMFDHMVPAHIARRVGWNHGFDTLQPGCRHFGRADGAAIGVGARPPSWSGIRSGGGLLPPSTDDRQCRDRSGGLDQRAGQLQPECGRSEVLRSAVTRGGVVAAQHPELGQALARPDATRVQCHLTGQCEARRPGRPLPTSSTARRCWTGRSVLSTRLWWSTRTTWPSRPQANYHQSSAAGEYAVPDLATTDHSSRASVSTRTATATMLTTHGKPLTLRMAVETGRPVDQLGGWTDQRPVAQPPELLVVQSGRAAVRACRARPSANSYDMALVTCGWPVPTSRLRRPGSRTVWAGGLLRHPELEQVRRSAGGRHCSCRRPNPLTRYRAGHLRADRRPAVGPDGVTPAVPGAGLGGQRGPARESPVQSVGGRNPVEYPSGGRPSSPVLRPPADRRRGLERLHLIGHRRLG